MPLFKKNMKIDKPSNQQVFQMVTTYGEHFYSWNGKV